MAIARKSDLRGVSIAATIVVLWLALLVYLLHWPVELSSPLTYVFVLLQMHLYTGLFITAHDAMHGVAAPGKPGLNRADRKSVV